MQHRHSLVPDIYVHRATFLSILRSPARNKGFDKMNMIIRETSARWLTPVYVRIGYGIPEAIRSPGEALNFLRYRWPILRRDAYHQAIDICSAAHRHPARHDASREAFIMACIEAKVLD